MNDGTSDKWEFGWPGTSADDDAPADLDESIPTAEETTIAPTGDAPPDGMRSMPSSSRAYPIDPLPTPPSPMSSPPHPDPGATADSSPSFTSQQTPGSPLSSRAYPIDPLPTPPDPMSAPPHPDPDGERPMPSSAALVPPSTRTPSISGFPAGEDVYRGSDYTAPQSPPRDAVRRRYGAPLPAESVAEPASRLKPSKWSTVVLPFLAGLVGAGLVVGGFLLFQDEADPAPAPAPSAAAEPIIRETIRTEFIGPEGSVADPTAVARKVIPSVVTVEVGVSDGDGGFSGTGSGSGVVLSVDGYIVTNEHVVVGSDVVTVSFSDGRLYQAEVLGMDALTDLAVLKIEAEGLVAIDIGSTEGLQIGDPAIAAGSPLGLAGGPTVTVGVISAFDREVQTGPAITDRLLGMLQTDAPITRGSSGGALVDAQGALIGVTSAVGVSDVGVEGIGFAIPIEVVIRITDELIETGEVTHSFLGIEGRTSFEDQFDGAEVAVGVFVQAIVDGTGASDAGLQEGDVITSINGRNVRTINSLVGNLRRYKVGEPLELEIVRAGEPLVLVVELGPRPDDI